MHHKQRQEEKTTIDGWRLGRRLGQGAWSEVFEATPAREGTERGDGCYALKMMRAEAERDPAALGILVNEGFVARQVSHPHLTTVLAAQLVESPRYLVLPLLAGTTLAALIERRGRLPVPQAVWVARQTCEAAAALHRAGWLHNDINPANIIVGPTGHATLIDLGVASKQAGGREANRRPLVGTLAYSAPEAFQSRTPMTPASDVYSLGVMLYEAVLGTRPFEDDDPLEVVRGHVELRCENIRDRLPHLPSRLARLVRRMLAKEPLRRPTPDELLATLTSLEIQTFGELRAG